MKNSEEHKYRRLVLTIWINARGGLNAMCKKSSLSKGLQSQLSAILRGYSLGNRAARQIEVKLGMPENWLDSIEGTNQINENEINIFHEKNKSKVLSSIASGLNIDCKTINIPYLSLNILKRKYKTLKINSNFQKIDNFEEIGFITDMRVSEKWLSTFIGKFSKKENLRIVTIIDDIEFPKLNTGDPVLVDVDTGSMNDDAFYLYKINDCFDIKKIEISDAKFKIYIEGDYMQPLILPINSNIIILGKVVKIWTSVEVA